MTTLAQVMFPDKANGQLIVKDGQVIGSRIIGQPFSSPGYFRSRPSAANVLELNLALDARSPIKK